MLLRGERILEQLTTTNISNKEIEKRNLWICNSVEEKQLKEGWISVTVGERRFWKKKKNYASVTLREADKRWGSVICASITVRGRSNRCG